MIVIVSHRLLHLSKPITTKAKEYRNKPLSIVKCGFTYMVSIVFNAYSDADTGVFLFSSCAYVD